MKMSLGDIITYALLFGVAATVIGYFYDRVKGIHETLKEILAELRSK